MSDLLFEMLIPRRPVSHQAKNRENLQAWKDYVYGRARIDWIGGTPIATQGLRLMLVYLCNDFPADIDNIIKPIQDALVGVVYADDSLISDVIEQMWFPVRKGNRTNNKELPDKR